MGLDIYFNRIKKQENEVAYFRKVNFLVKFFEDQLEQEVPNCQGIYVSKELAEELLDRCNRVLDCHDLASELLPSMSGFFFGHTEYDEYYFDNVQAVKNSLIEDILPQYENLAEDEHIEFFIWY